VPTSGRSEAEGEELRAVVESLQLRVAELSGALAQRDARIAELETLLESSRRAGKRQAAPFSKNEPKSEPKRPGRKRAESHGRHGHRLTPLGPIDRELEVPLPSSCPHCAGELELERVAEQFQVDLPEPRPKTTKFNVAIGRCRNCRRRVQGHHPDQVSDALGAAGSMLGPLARSLGLFLHYGLGLSFAKTARLLGQLGVPVTAGALPQQASSTSTALVPVRDEIVARLNSSAVVVADETGWRVGGRRGWWLWTATSKDATAYWIAEGRGYEEACQVLSPEFSGVLVRDGWGPYRLYTNATAQSCLAHLIRRCEEMYADLPCWARSTPRRVYEILIESLEARELDKDERLEVVADLAERMELVIAEPEPHPENRRLLKHLDNELPALFTFLCEEGVDATNWRAETAIRPAVVNRKVWGGNRTEHGAEVQGVLMSVLRSAAQQGHDVIEYLARCARAPTSADLPALFLPNPLAR
jgi:transposase